MIGKITRGAVFAVPRVDNMPKTRHTLLTNRMAADIIIENSMNKEGDNPNGQLRL